MVEITNTKTENDATQTPGAPAAAPDSATNIDHTKIKGRFNQYQSGYWSLAIPLLSVRYIAQGISGIFKPFYDTIDIVSPKNEPKPNWMPKWIPKDADKLWAPFVGAGMVVVTSIYTAITYGDMKRQFKEPLGWEFGKNPENVNILDMIKSKNTLVHDAVKNLAKRTFLRLAVHIPFFLFLAPSPFKNSPHIPTDLKEKYSNFVGPSEAVNLGVGTNAMYLVSDAFNRKQTFFEELQNLIDLKINHNGRVGESVTAADLINLYDRQARYNPDVLPLPKMDAPEWQNDMKLFERMADLMNQTYGNVPNVERADFTVPKLIYMLGMRLLKSEDPAKNMAYLEIANRYGIKAVEQVAKIANGHGDLKAALEPYPDVALKVLNVQSAAPEVAEEIPAKSFANEELMKKRPDATLASFTEKATQKGDTAVALGG